MRPKKKQIIKKKQFLYVFRIRANNNKKIIYK